MKFDLASDLHLEIGGAIECIDGWVRGANYLVLAGDITSIEHLKKDNRSAKANWQFLLAVSKMYDEVIWVFGNHEYYDGYLNYAIGNANHLLKKWGIENIHILNRHIHYMGGVAFFGATMWTDFDKENPTAMSRAETGLNDYNYIQLNDVYLEDRKIRADDILNQHKMSRKKLEEFCEMKIANPKVVVTHHAPSYLSIPEVYKTHALNAAYATEMFDTLYDSDVKVAVHGHIHLPANYKIGETRVISNPRGYYGYEPAAMVWTPITIEV